jgi:hypothetical protein
MTPRALERASLRDGATISIERRAASLGHSGTTVYRLVQRIEKPTKARRRRKKATKR